MRRGQLAVTEQLAEGSPGARCYWTRKDPRLPRLKAEQVELKLVVRFAKPC